MRSPAVYCAAIGGACGGGLEMSVCFDVRLAADDDSVGSILPELHIGLTTTVGGQRLARLINPARALEMMLEGRMYSPQEAQEMGLLNRLVPQDNLLDEATAPYTPGATGNHCGTKEGVNENLLLNPAESLRPDGAANTSAIMPGPAAEALRKWVDMQKAGDGDSVFLTDLQPRIPGEVVELNAREQA